MRIFLTIAAMLLAHSIYAQLLMNEEFSSLSNGNLSGQGSWTTVNNTSITMTVANASPLSACTGIGGRYVQTGAGATFTTERLSFPTADYVASAGQVFFLSFVLNVTNPGTDLNGHIISTGNDAGAFSFEFMRLHVRLSGAGYNIGISEGGGTGLGPNSFGIVWGSAVLQLNTAYHIVMRYDYVASGLNNDEIRVWANPGIIAGSEPSTASAQATIAAGTQGNDILYDGDDVRNVYLNNRINGPTYQIDAIRYARGATSAAAWSNLAITSTCVALPVTWIQVGVRGNAIGKPALRWEVVENDVDRYIIERSVGDGPFEAVAEESSAGNGQNQYEWVDMQYVSGRVAYRLHQVDRNGRDSYSSICVFKKVGISATYIFPNPAADVLQLVVAPELVNSQAVLLNANGQVIRKISITNLQTPVPVDNLGLGLYLIKFEDGSAAQFVKQ